MAAAIRVIASALLVVATAQAHRCIHGELQRTVELISGPQSYQHSGRRLQSTQWAPIRITPVYINITSSLNTTQATYVQNLVSTVLTRWSNLLKVQPVQGALFAHRRCSQAFTSVLPNKCSQYDSSPLTCNAGDGSSVQIPTQYIGSDPYYTSAGSTTPQYVPALGPGLANSDTAILVTALSTAACASGTVAYAYTCQRDEFDRPTFGRINVCSSELDMSPDKWDFNVYLVLHEVGHALGFSSESWPLFRYPDTNRTARTPRNPANPALPADSYKITTNCNGQTVTTYIPANNTVAYFSERGLSQCTVPNGIGNPLNCVAKFVTPEAVSAARWYFGCNSLNGAELENQMTTACDLQGSHWEQRIFGQDFLGSYLQHRMVLSPLTIAVMIDSGWYQSDYNATDWLRPQSDYGFQQGCDFASNKCINASTATALAANPPHFYTTQRSDGNFNAVCVPDARGVAYASINNYSSALPPQFQYFTGQPLLGGATLATADYCPVPQVYSNEVCFHTSQSLPLAISYAGGGMAANAACLTSTLFDAGYNPIPQGASCYPIACVDANTLNITIAPPANSQRVNVVTCTSATAGRPLTVPGFTGSLICPDPARFCGQVFKYTGAMQPAAATAGPWPFPNAAPTPMPSPSSPTPMPPSPSPSKANSAMSPAANPAIALGGVILATALLAMFRPSVNGQ